MIARAENRSMVESIPIPLVPVEQVPVTPGTAVVMVDSQPYTGRRASEDGDAAGGDRSPRDRGGADRGPVPRYPSPRRGDEHDGDRLPARTERGHSAPTGDGTALRDRVGDLRLPPRGRSLSTTGPGLAVPPRRQGPAGPDPQPEAPPEPFRDGPARPGQRIPLPGRDRELVGTSLSPTSSPRWPTSSSASIRSTGP